MGPDQQCQGIRWRISCEFGQKNRHTSSVTVSSRMKHNRARSKLQSLGFKMPTTCRFCLLMHRMANLMKVSCFLAGSTGPRPTMSRWKEVAVRGRNKSSSRQSAKIALSRRLVRWNVRVAQLFCNLRTMPGDLHSVPVPLSAECSKAEGT